MLTNNSMMSNLNLKLMKTKLLSIFLIGFAVVLNLCAQTDPGATNLTHLWNFDDGTANDPVGELSGILNGTTTVVDGKLVIDAADEWVTLPAGQIGINAYTALSVAITFFTLDTTGMHTAVNNGFHMIWYFGGSEVDGLGGTAQFGSNGIFLSPARGDDVCRTAISCGNIATPWTAETGINYTPELRAGGQKYHIVTTINSTYLAMYVNGALVDTANLSTNNKIANLKNDFAWIGRGGYSGDPNYWCKVDEMRVYDKMLSDAEVLYLYQHATAIQEVENPTGLDVWASNGNLFISNYNNAVINSVKIYNVVGKLVKDVEKYNGVIRHNLPAGIYIVSVNSNLGVFTSKLYVK